MMKHLDPSAVFRGVVVNNQDPDGQNRVQLQVPQIMGGARSGWASPIPAVGVQIPDVGTQVMMTFEGGDLTRPAYFAATSSGVSQDAYALASQAEKDAQKGITAANGAQRTADAAQVAASQAQTLASTAQTLATSAQTSANQAEKDAQTGITNAAAANSLATSAASMAKSATSMAGTAASTSQQALDTANQALNTADSASATVNSQGLGDSGWISFSDAGINFTSGFASYGNTCRFRAVNGVAYLLGSVQVSTAMTSGSTGAQYTLATWAAGSVAATYLDGGAFGGYIGAFYSGATNIGSGGLYLSASGRALQLGYRSVAQLATGYFAFNASFPYR